MLGQRQEGAVGCRGARLKYERIDAGMEHGVVQTPEYKKMNPMSLVPTIEDDGFVCGNARDRAPIFPPSWSGYVVAGGCEAARSSDRWMDWAHTFAREFQRPVFWALAHAAREARHEHDQRGREEVRQSLLAVPDQARAPLVLGGDSLAHRRHSARLPRAALDATASQAPGAREPHALVRAPGAREERRSGGSSIPRFA